ncbi:MAG: hypothetical protein ACE14P_11775 [Methanotrichaceae archaeon]
MRNSYHLAVLICLAICSIALTASAQEQVTFTVYVHEGIFNGTALSGVQVTGYDAIDNSFADTTDADGAAALSGQPGTWQFIFTKAGYETLKLSYDVTETDYGDVYLQKST